MSSPKRRIETDVMKMYDPLYDRPRSTLDYDWLMSDYEVTLVNDNSDVRFCSPTLNGLCSLNTCVEWRGSWSYRQEFYVRFKGPEETPFSGGLWKIHVELPDQYPYKSPSIGFVNRIFHPNIDELSGSVCLDVINQTWSPMFDMINIFEVFLPQLLRYPNPTDPLNGEAAALLMREPKSYEAKVKGEKHAERLMGDKNMIVDTQSTEYVSKYATKDAADEAGDDSESEEEMSSVGSFESGDEEPAGQMEV
ncbi:hypothetical protein MMC24_006669 [Lignoscripta atroalba]|nr:hypothetical protein [Lignoscripta atroalba]